MYQYNLEGERKVWESLEKTMREVIEAKDALIVAKEETIRALQLALANRLDTV